MQHPPQADPAAVPPPLAPPPAVRVPPRRLLLHAVLVLLTLVTLAWAGGTFWSPPEVGDEFLATATLRELAVRIFAAGVPYAIWVFLILLSHEMGHYLACRYYRIPATLPFFIPAPFMLGTLGAVIRIRGRIPDRKALFDIAAAGPIAGFIVALVPFAVGLATAAPSAVDPELHGIVREHGKPLLRILLGALLTPHDLIRLNALYGAGWVGMLVTSLNLFPVGQLDGGHAAYALSRRLHRGLSWLTLAGLLGAVAYQALVVREVPVYALWFVILLWMRDRHPRLLDETEPLGGGRKLVALVLVLIFALTFILVPIRFISI